MQILSLLIFDIPVDRITLILVLLISLSSLILVISPDGIFTIFDFNLFNILIHSVSKIEKKLGFSSS